MLLAYAYHHTFSEDFRLNGGLHINYGQLNFINGIVNPDNETTIKRYGGGLGFGLAFNYKKLYAGLSSNLPVFLKKDVLTADSISETRKEDTDSYYFHFLTGYSLGRPGKLTFDPVFGLDYNILNDGQSNKLKGYLGANLEIRNLVGIGFTMGNLVSLSTSLNILDRATLILGIYAGEHALFSSVMHPDYRIGRNEFQIIGQIRVNL